MVCALPIWQLQRTLTKHNFLLQWCTLYQLGINCNGSLIMSRLDPQG